MLIANTPLDSYKIILPAAALEGERDAAEVLRDTLTRATGVTLEIATDASPAADCEIVIGQTNRDTDKVTAARAEIQNDGYAMVMDGTRLYITGNLPRGGVYGVYTFMEDYLGARFYSDTYMTVHDGEVKDVPADLYRVDSPYFFSRDTYWYHILHPRRPTKMNIRNAVKSNHWDMPDLGGGVTYAGPFVHSIWALAEIPHEIGVQPCLTDEKTYENVRKNVRRVLQENPSATIVSVSQVDSYPDQLGCQCEKCKAIDDREGTPMGSLLTFVNRIADDIKDDYPNVYVDTLAYRYTRKAPKTIKPRDNVIIRLCSIECCFCHPLDDPNCPHNVEFKKDIEEWAAICNNLYIWDYTTDFLCYLSPFPNLAVLQKNVKFFKDHHVIGMFEQGNYQSLSGEFGELRGYLLAKLLWNPDMTEAEYYAHMDEFLRDYYGAGWPYIREYIDVTSKKAAERHLFIYDTPNRIFPFDKKEADDPDLDILDPEKIEAWSRELKNSSVTALTDETAFATYLLDLWNKALAAAECDDHRAHVRQSRVQALYYAEFALPTDRFEELNKLMLDDIRATGITRYRETADIPDLNDPAAYPDLR
ncbi:MAG: DUF4838 domain-containing protein [Clostridia bacterium]|nr:DUF4838 domain-containing protein [Clostridia bacterium]